MKETCILTFQSPPLMNPSDLHDAWIRVYAETWRNFSHLLAWKMNPLNAMDAVHDRTNSQTPY